jgi:hypothetical protein
VALFKVLMHGTGIRIPALEGEGHLVGFYRVQRVWAATAKVAEERALGAVRHDWVEGRCASYNARPALEVDRVTKVSLLQFLSHKNGGHLFYADDDDAAAVAG